MYLPYCAPSAALADLAKERMTSSFLIVVDVISFWYLYESSLELPLLEKLIFFVLFRVSKAFDFNRFGFVQHGPRHYGHVQMLEVINHLSIISPSFTIHLLDEISYNFVSRISRRNSRIFTILIFIIIFL